MAYVTKKEFYDFNDYMRNLPTCMEWVLAVILAQDCFFSGYAEVTYDLPEDAFFNRIMSTKDFKESAMRNKVIYRDRNHSGVLPAHPIRIDGELYRGAEIELVATRTDYCTEYRPRILNYSQIYDSYGENIVKFYHRNMEYVDQITERYLLNSKVIEVSVWEPSITFYQNPRNPYDDDLNFTLNFKQEGYQDLKPDMIAPFAQMIYSRGWRADRMKASVSEGYFNIYIEKDLRLKGW